MAALRLLCCKQVFPCCSKQQLLSSWGMRISHRGGFSHCRAQVLGYLGFSSCSSRDLEYVLSSCGTWVLLLCGMWDPPGSGIELVYLELVGRFFISELPGKPEHWFFFFFFKEDFYTIFSVALSHTLPGITTSVGSISKGPFLLPIRGEPKEIFRFAWVKINFKRAVSGECWD